MNINAHKSHSNEEWAWANRAKKKGGDCKHGMSAWCSVSGFKCVKIQEMVSHLEGLRFGLLENTIQALFRLMGSLLGGHFPQKTPKTRDFCYISHIPVHHS